MSDTQSVTAVDPAVGLWDVDNTTYHADRSCASHTTLDEFRDSPFLYHGRYISGTIPRRKSTEAMRLGTALHAMLLEPEKFDSLIAVEPVVNGRTNEGKAVRKEFAESTLLSGKTVITAEQNALLVPMVKNVLAHDEVRALLKMPHKREQAVVWVDPATGIRCKCKPDIWTDVGLVADIKSAADPAGGAWARMAGTLGYQRQNAFYVDGCKAQTGRDHKMMHVVVGNSEESGFECCCYFLDELFEGDMNPVELGRSQNSKALRDLAECRRIDDWRAPRNREVQIVNLPRYYFFEE